MIEVFKGYTFSGYTINVIEDEFCLTITESGGNFISDNKSEIVLDHNFFDIKDIFQLQDSDLQEMFLKAKKYLEEIKKYQENETNINNDI
ncbi:MAG: hypothetical protein NZZ41_04820 [Candidatus Dojkabacteria bacterium]|nr:hypothetical protein [Candidatus Dojkabacteria bacterium]